MGIPGDGGGLGSFRERWGRVWEPLGHRWGSGWVTGGGPRGRGGDSGSRGGEIRSRWELSPSRRDHQIPSHCAAPTERTPISPGREPRRCGGVTGRGPSRHSRGELHPPPLPAAPCSGCSPSPPPPPELFLLPGSSPRAAASCPGFPGMRLLPERFWSRGAVAVAPGGAGNRSSSGVGRAVPIRNVPGVGGEPGAVQLWAVPGVEGGSSGHGVPTSSHPPIPVPRVPAAAPHPHIPILPCSHLPTSSCPNSRLPHPHIPVPSCPRAPTFPRPPESSHPRVPTSPGPQNIPVSPPPPIPTAPPRVPLHPRCPRRGVGVGGALLPGAALPPGAGRGRRCSPPGADKGGGGGGGGGRAAPAAPGQHRAGRRGWGGHGAAAAVLCCPAGGRYRAGRRYRAAPGGRRGGRGAPGGVGGVRGVCPAPGGALPCCDGAWVLRHSGGIRGRALSRGTGAAHGWCGAGSHVPPMPIPGARRRPRRVVLMVTGGPQGPVHGAPPGPAASAWCPLGRAGAAPPVVQTGMGR